MVKKIREQQNPTNGGRQIKSPPEKESQLEWRNADNRSQTWWMRGTEDSKRNSWKWDRKWKSLKGILSRGKRWFEGQVSLEGLMVKRKKETRSENEDYQGNERESQNQKTHQPGLHSQKSAFYLEKMHYILPTEEGTLKLRNLIKHPTACLICNCWNWIVDISKWTENSRYNII